MAQLLAGWGFKLNDTDLIFSELTRLQKHSLPSKAFNGSLQDLHNEKTYSWLLSDLKITDFKSVEIPDEVEKLYVRDCKKLTSTIGMSKLKNLKTLWIYGSDKISSLEDLPNLVLLIVSPSFNGKIKIVSLETISKLQSLETLYFAGNAIDGSLSSLHNLKKLKTLFLSNSYEWKEFATLEAKQKNLDFAWKGGVVYNANPNLLKCKICDGPLAMLTGKGLPMVCPDCNPKKIKTHLQRYTAIAKN
jgi:Leucine-rich repeat (LRR) protein